MLKETTIIVLHSAIVRAQLDRVTLLSGVSPEYASTIPVGTNVASQTVLDIRHLAKAKGGDPHPLVSYLKTAIVLTTCFLEEQRVFQDALAEARRSLAAKPGATWGAPTVAVRNGAIDETYWPGDRVRCFLSAHKRDSKVREKIETHLSPLVRAGVIDVWRRERVPVGLDVEAITSARLAQADIVIFVLSADFVASEKLMSEADATVARARGPDPVRIVPLLASACGLGYTPFARLETWPRHGSPISSHSNPDEVYLEVADAIHEMVDDARGGAASGSTAPDERRRISQAASSEGKAPRGILEIVPFPWEDERAQSLHELLVIGYQDINAARALGQDVGIPPHRWNQQGDAWTAWRRLIERAVLMGRLGALVRRVLDTPEVQGIHAGIEAAIHVASPDEEDT